MGPQRASTGLGDPVGCRTAICCGASPAQQYPMSGSPWTQCSGYSATTARMAQRPTKKDRPWEYVVVVSGFASSTAAKCFEYAWQQPRTPWRTMHCHAGTPARKGPHRRAHESYTTLNGLTLRIWIRTVTVCFFVGCACWPLCWAWACGRACVCAVCSRGGQGPRACARWRTQAALH